MINLAGKRDCDKTIESELNRCGIPFERLHAPTTSEVPSAILGKWGKFKFYRAWYYWVVNGPMPIAIAKELYHDNVVGKVDIRVVGHCGCPPPEEWVDYIHPSGKEVLSQAKWDENMKTLDGFGKELGDSIRADLVSKYLPHENPESFPGFIPNYHIDTELGLYIFAEAIRKHKLYEL